MSKFLQLLLSGMFFTFLLDFFLFLGLYLHYIQALEIPLYYNIFFVDNQSFLLYFGVSFCIGFVLLYMSQKVSLLLIGTLFLAVFSTLIEPIGFKIGSIFFMQTDKTLYTKKFQYRGDIYYDGRKEIYFYDTKLDKMLTFEKNKIKELH